MAAAGARNGSSAGYVAGEVKRFCRELFAEESFAEKWGGCRGGCGGPGPPK
jgi:hypothetical protein